jgi:type IV secretory pathway VirB10-like protein
MEGEQLKTGIAEEKPAAPRKPGKRVWVLISLGAVLLIVALWVLIANLRKPGAHSRPPTAEEIEQQKYDSDQKDREKQKAAQIHDQSFLVRKDDDSQAQLNGLLKDLDIKKDSGTDLPRPLDDHKAKSEEEAIAHVLRSPTPAPSRSAAVNEIPRRQSPQAAAQPDAGSMSPMFVYSRDFGGAKYVDMPPKQAAQPPDIASVQRDVNSSARVTKPENSPKPDQPPVEEKSHLIYTEYPPVTLYEGEMLDAVLVNRIIADTEASPLVCRLARDLFDQSARYIVLPASSRITGYSQVVNYKGAHRLFVNFNRIILPNGPSFELPSSRKALRALDETGAMGVVSQVERHWFLQFGTSIFFGVLDGLAGAAQRNQDVLSTGAVVLGRTSENFGKILENIMAQYSTIVPTITVNQGKTMKIYLSDDIVISPYAKITERSYYASR